MVEALMNMMGLRIIKLGNGYGVELWDRMPSNPGHIHTCHNYVLQGSLVKDIYPKAISCLIFVLLVRINRLRQTLRPLCGPS